MGFYLGALVAALLASCPAHAYTATVSPGGTPVRWKGTARIPLAGNPSNRNGISESSFYSAVVRSLQRWKAASGGSATFDYWQGTDAATYEPNSQYNGLSSIYFASNAKGDTGISSNVLGLTQVWYNTDTGEILETDIVLNDLSYRFTLNPADTSGYGSGATAVGDGRTVFIENVLTHEIGHAFGLSHSGGLQSTMLFMESPEQAFLGCDEQVGIRAVYPSHDSGARGAIRGTVVSPTGAPVFGAHVLAVSRQRGAVLATAVTDRSGTYALGALDPGAYFLMAEPFFAGASALPAYYNGISANVCSGRAFSRTVLTDAGGEPQTVSAGAGGAVSAPALTVRCEGGGAAITARSSTSSPTGAPTVYDAAEGGSGFGVIDRFAYSGTLYYRLRSVSGRIEAHALAYSLYSPVDPTVEILDQAGRVVSTQAAPNVYPGTSGFVNFDSAAIAVSLPAGDYYVRVTYAGLNSTYYPGGSTSLDTVPFVLVTGSVNEGTPALSSSLAVNARCRMDENFAAYSSPPGGPERRSMDEDDGGIGFCGTVERAGEKLSRSGRGPGNLGGPGAGAIAGWFLPWALMGAIARLAWRSAQLRARLGGATL
jgi:hypothetical protein